MPKIKHVYVDGKLVGIGNVKVEEIEKEPRYFVTVTHDDWVEFPYKDDDFIKLYSNNRNYDFNNLKLDELLSKFKETPKDVDTLVQKLNKAGSHSYIPVYGYVHSGLTVSLAPFSCRFDSGLLGILQIDSSFTNAKVIAKDWVKTVNMFLQNDVYCVKITNELGEGVDDICGIYAMDGKSLADEALDYLSDNYKISKEDIITAYNKLYYM